MVVKIIIKSEVSPTHTHTHMMMYDPYLETNDEIKQCEKRKTETNIKRILSSS